MPGFDRLFDPERDAAIVTGAGNGIGRAIALGLVAEGVRTVFADVNSGTLAAAVRTAADPALASAWTGDLAQKTECDRLLVDARKKNGLITLLVHSASPPVVVSSVRVVTIEWPPAARTESTVRVPSTSSPAVIGRWWTNRCSPWTTRL